MRVYKIVVGKQAEYLDWRGQGTPKFLFEPARHTACNFEKSNSAPDRLRRGMSTAYMSLHASFFSVCLPTTFSYTHQLVDGPSFPVRQAAWYAKTLPTFSDTLAFVRQHLWPSTDFCMSSSEHDVVKIPRALFDRLVDTLAFTA
jgi:hypothetical protein